MDHHDPGRRSLTISCDDCAMQCTTHCDDCVVTFVVRAEPAADASHHSSSHPSAHGTRPVTTTLVLDEREADVVRMLARAGLVPELRYELAG